MECLSIRVSRADRDGPGSDWIEWIAPIGFQKANRLAVDHFAERALQEALNKLRARQGTGLRPKLIPDPESPHRGETMPPTKTTAKPAEPAPKTATRSKTSKAAASETATPAKPGPKPGPKPKAKTKAASKPAEDDARGVPAATKPKTGPQPKAKRKAK